LSDSLERLTAALATSYLIEREVGAGGMATVYLAEDLKHHRKVAVKVLRPDLAATLGADRFLREVTIAANLQHPHILPLYDSGESGGFLYYVMPFVEGTSLREKLRREGELPIHDAVRILRDVADALAYAHQHGVVHRDIKPENVMLSGRHALVTDFGVAKAISEATGRQKLTTAGVALGTPSYMAPEQAAADPGTDHRADIYAFGAMAYELVAGQPPFVGPTPQAVLAAHLTTEPVAVASYRESMPHALADLVMKCLQKKPADRFQTAEELIPQLEAVLTPSGGITPTGMLPVPRTSASRWRRITMGVAGIMVLAAVAWLGVGTWGSGGGPTPLNLGSATQVTTEDGLEIHPSISPNGNLIAFAAGTSQRMRIFIRPVAGGRTIPLSDDSTAVEIQPRWSPDGTQLLFLSRGGLYVSPALGGSARLLASGGSAPIVSAAWSPTGDEVAMVRGDSLLVQHLSGGVPRFLVERREIHSCDWAPQGDLIACAVENGGAVWPGSTFGNLAPSWIGVVSVHGGALHDLTGTGASHMSPVWSGDGRVLYFVSNRHGPRDVYGVAVHDDGTAAGEPVRMTTGLNAQSIGLAGDGSQLVYSLYASRGNIWSVPIPSGRTVGLEEGRAITSGNQVIESIRVSPDRRWLIYDSNIGGDVDIYRVPVDGGTPERLTTDPSDDFAGDLSPDGQTLAFHSWRTDSRDIFVRSLGTGIEQQLTETDGQESYPVWSPDGQQIIAFDQSAPATALLIARDGAGGWGDPVAVVTGAFAPSWSPDGQQIAYYKRDGSIAVFRPLAPESERIVYRPRSDSDDPRASRVEWGRSASELFFKSFDELGRARIYSLPSAGGQPTLLIAFDDPSRPSNRRDFTHDGRNLFVPIDDRQSNIWVAELSPP